MSKAYEPSYYTQYVRHAIRFYSRYLHIKGFRNDVDRLNWQACHKAIQNYSEQEKDILVKVYGEVDTLGDNVFNVSKQYRINQDAIWSMMLKYEREVAVERGLV